MWFLKIKFRDVAETVLKLKQLKSKNTYLSAKRQISRLIVYFGPLPIHKITETHWSEYLIAELGKGARKFYDDRKYMRMILIHAHREGLIEKRPRLSIPDLPSRIGREITSDEITRLLANAKPELAFQIEIAWKMGLRLREMLYLRWEQFDWKRSTINFEASDTKTRRPREVPINPDLIFPFHQRCSETRSIYVFPSITKPGAPQHSNKSAWRRCKRAAGVRARWHDLRHTAATVMLRRGANREATRLYLGMTEKVLLQIYSHLNLNDLRGPAQIMSSSGPKQPSVY